jgi:hypothetical protein
MGLGLINRAQQAMDFQVNGIAYVSADTRDYVLNIGAYNINALVTISYESDNTGAPPDQKLSTVTTNISSLFEGRIQFGTSETVVPAGYVIVAGARLGITRGLRYSSVTANPVVPTLKHLKWILQHPDRIKHFAIYGGGASSQGNCIQVTDFKLPYMPNLKTMFLKGAQTQAPVGAQIQNIKGYFPKSLEVFAYFFISGTIRLQSIERPFPASLKRLMLASNYAALGADISRLIAPCVNLEGISLCDEQWTMADPNTNSCTPFSGGDLDLQHAPPLKYISIHNAPGLTGVLVSGSASNLFRIRVTNCINVTNANLLSLINLLLSSNAGEYLNIGNCNRTITRNFVDADFKDSLTQFYIHNNRITGSISITVPKPNLTKFHLGNDSVILDSSKHDFASVNVSGVIASPQLDLSNSQIVNLTLPSTSVITELNIGGNKLSVTTNPSLIAQINALSALTTLCLATSTSTGIGSYVGQNSVDGFGNNLTLTVSTLTYLIAVSCKLTGTLTVPSGMQTLILNDNNLTGLQGPSGGNLNSLTTLRIFGNVNANFDFTKFRNVVSLVYSDSTVTTLIDISGKTTTTTNSLCTITNNTALTEIRFPSVAANCVFNAAANIFSISNNPLLANIVNIDKFAYTSSNSARQFYCFNNALNIDFKIAVNDTFLPTEIRLQNNGMSTAMVDQNITNIWNGRAKWATAGLTAARSLNIGGTNGPVTGLYQAFSGPGGTPASAKEMIYDLVTNYGWIITYN